MEKKQKNMKSGEKQFRGGCTAEIICLEALIVFPLKWKFCLQIIL